MGNLRSWRRKLHGGRPKHISGKQREKSKMAQFLVKIEAALKQRHEERQVIGQVEARVRAQAEAKQASDGVRQA